MKKSPCSAATRHTSASRVVRVMRPPPLARETRELRRDVAEAQRAKAGQQPATVQDCSVSGTQLPVERVDVADETIDLVARDHRLPAALPHAAALLAIAEQRDDRGGKRARIAERRQPS